MPTLVIVESPGKIKKIQSILGKDYKVMASVGHVMDLNEKSLSIEITKQQDDTFLLTPSYVPIKKKKNVISGLVHEKSKHDNIIIATDNDREGEFIAFSLKSVLNLQTYQRIVFNEITSSSIWNAVRHPIVIDDLLVQSQQTRRILDRLIGYKINLGKGLSVGRVQSAVVRLIIDKESEIQNELQNIKKSFKTIGTFQNDMKAVLSTDKTDMKSELSYLISINPYHINDIEFSSEKHNPPPPYITSSLQQDAFNLLHLNAQKTMTIAQSLYEKGYITYMRTDSVHINKEFGELIKNYITEKYGARYYTFHSYKNKKHSQEAHECIRPTRLDETIDASDMEMRLYRLIFNRTAASVMSPVEYQTQKLTIKNKDEFFEPRYFQETLKKLTFDGYKILYGIDKKDDIVENIAVGDFICIKKLISEESVHYNKSRYNEASLIKKLEQSGIGRPSTFANIVQLVRNKNYVRIGNADGIEADTTLYSISVKNKNLSEKQKKVRIGYEKQKWMPTDLGININQYLMKHFPNIIDEHFTSLMESDLDKIADGRAGMQTVLHSFFSIFSRQLTEAVPFSSSIQNDNHKYLGKDDANNTYHVMKGKWGLVLQKKYADQYNTIQYFPITDKTIPLEKAVQIASCSILLGHYYKKPVFFFTNGKYGPYLKYNGKNINTRSQHINSLHDALPLMKKNDLKTRIY